jgi:hypothetical protein
LKNALLLEEKKTRGEKNETWYSIGFSYLSVLILRRKSKKTGKHSKRPKSWIARNRLKTARFRKKSTEPENKMLSIKWPRRKVDCGTWISPLGAGTSPFPPLL